jgi:hypothetical protein
LLGEAKAELFGMVQGAREGVVAAYKAFKTEEPQLDARSTRPSRVHPRRCLRDGQHFGREIRSAASRPAFRFAARAEDEFFKSVAFRGDINRQAYAIAAKEGLPPEQIQHARLPNCRPTRPKR